jgi:hypothetical protein|tara:strand:- start:6 stop:137 length:132 start_codon:yes stop_codon:yes gene_type:complete
MEVMSLPKNLCADSFRRPPGIIEELFSATFFGVDLYVNGGCND